MALSLTSQHLIQIKQGLDKLRQNAKYSFTSKAQRWIAHLVVTGDL